jgi:hypothetical protein
MHVTTSVSKACHEFASELADREQVHIDLDHYRLGRAFEKARKALRDLALLLDSGKNWE